MKEVVFIKRNIDRWNHFEKLIENKDRRRSGYFGINVYSDYR